MSIKIEITEEMKRSIVKAICMEKGRKYIEEIMEEIERKKVVDDEVVIVEETTGEKKGEVRRKRYERKEISEELRCKGKTCRGNRCTFYVVEKGYCQRHIRLAKSESKGEA